MDAFAIVRSDDYVREDGPFLEEKDSISVAALRLLITSAGYEILI